ITYRIYDYNRRDAKGNARQLHTLEAKDAINYTVGDRNRINYEQEKNAPNEIISCPYFTTSILHLDEDMQLDYSELDSFVVLICLEGACKLESIDGSITLLNEGETVLIPACVDTVAVLPINEVRLLETFV
ncbi:MAG: mannose-6-phosphate isomerase, partial [Bacteroidales bacterium]|nr:mannose-6-phosphate isomerase [Bacteroidales bacterium]